MDEAAERFEQVEGWVGRAVEWLRLAVETLGAAIIAVGFVVALAGLARHYLRQPGTSFTAVRLAFARYLTLALELQLAADILSTSVAPTWERIGKLAAIAVIRTALNYFLSREMAEEQRAAAEGRSVDHGKPPSTEPAGRTTRAPAGPSRPR